MEHSNCWAVFLFYNPTFSLKVYKYSLHHPVFATIKHIYIFFSCLQGHDVLFLRVWRDLCCHYHFLYSANTQTLNFSLNRFSLYVVMVVIRLSSTFSNFECTKPCCMSLCIYMMWKCAPDCKVLNVHVRKSNKLSFDKKQKVHLF